MRHADLHELLLLQQQRVVTVIDNLCSENAVMWAVATFSYIEVMLYVRDARSSEVGVGLFGTNLAEFAVENEIRARGAKGYGHSATG